MIEYKKDFVKKNVMEFKFQREGQQKFTFEDFINISKNKNDSEDFANAMTRALKESKTVFESFFWECPPIDKDTIGDQFTFATIDAPSLNGIEQNYLDFEEHFIRDRDKLVCSFPNLGGDATLVVPIPKKGKDFAHLANFNENADSDTKIKLWEKVAKELGNFFLVLAIIRNIVTKKSVLFNICRKST